jgi:serine/threonine protein kinase
METVVSRPQHGGKLIGKGSYGCVFDPPLACKGILQKKGKGREIGKLTTKGEAKKEIYMSKLLGDVPNVNQYLTILTNSCIPKPREEQEEPDLRKCDVIVRKSDSQFIQLIMPYSGQPLTFHKKQIKSGGIDFFQFGRHLLEACTILLTHGVIHFDLHRGNILAYNINKPVIIDFGLSWHINMINRIAKDLASYNFEPQYAQYSPELSLPEAITHSLTINDALLEEILEKKRVSRQLETVYGVPFENILQDFKEFAYDSISLEKQNWMKYYKTYWPKFDAWSIGRILLDMYYTITTNKGYKATEKDEMYAIVLKGLCAVNPKKRLTAARALQLWDARSPLLQRTEVQPWLAHTTH